MLRLPFFHLIFIYATDACCLNQEMLKRADSDASNEINFAEFVEYMLEHERKLKLAFSDLDRNKDGEHIMLVFCKQKQKYTVSG
jgi:hypothetical protein